MSDMYQQLAQKVYAVLYTYADQQKFTLVLDASNQQNSPGAVGQSCHRHHQGDRRRLQRQIRRPRTTGSWNALRHDPPPPVTLELEPPTPALPSQHAAAVARLYRMPLVIFTGIFY